MEDGHHLDQVQGEEEAAQHDQLRVKEWKEDDQMQLALVEVRAVFQEGLEVEGLVRNQDEESLEVRVVPCSVPHSERAVERLEEAEEVLQVFQDVVGSFVAEGGQRIHCVAEVDEGQTLLRRAVDQSYEHQVAELEV